MYKVQFRVTAVASVALVVAVFSPYAVQAQKSITSATSAVASVSEPTRSTFVISEQTVDKKTFTVGETIVDATPLRVWDVLTDYDGAARIFSNLNESKLVGIEGSTKFVSLSVRTAGNLLRLDYTLAVTEKRPILLEYKRASGAFRAYEGYWKLEPLDGGKKTLVTFAKYIDGGFFFPQVFVKKAIRDSIPVIFAELEGAAESPHIATSQQ